MSIQSNRRGFTLVELLVVLAILAVFMAFVLSAVQMAREASRRLQCQNSIRQVGLAVISYEHAHRRYPPAMISGMSPYWAVGPQLEMSITLPAQLLSYPYSPVEPFDQSGSWPILVCPSDRAGTGTSYRFNTGSGPYLSNRFGNLPGGGNGPFNDRETISSSAVSDGLSNTALVSERCRGFGTIHRKSVVVGDVTINSLISAARIWPDAVTFRDACASSSAADVYVYAGRDWLRGGYFFSTYNHVLVPNSSTQACTNINTLGPSPVTAAALGPTSWHSAGANVAHCDGHVSLVRSAIDYDVWQALGARDDGQAIALEE